jgi:bifunctional DNase/RNase
MAFRSSAVVVASLLVSSCSAAPRAEPTEDAAPRPEPRPRPTPADADADLLPAEIATVGWDSLHQSPVVLLQESGSGQTVPIWVGPAEGQAIAAALREIAFPRPMTHDLMASLLKELGAELQEVVVYDLVEGTYLGRLKLRTASGGAPLVVETRPSDGLALALRTKAAIRIHRKILTKSPEFEFVPPDVEGQVVRSLDMTVVAVSEKARRDHGLPDRAGVLVARATGRAAEAGLRRGDLLVGVNGVVPKTPVDFLEAIQASPPTQPVTLRYWRKGKEREVQVTPALPRSREHETAA